LLSDWLKKSHANFSTTEKEIAPCTRYVSRAWSKLQVTASNSHWFIALFAPVVIGRDDYFGIAFFDSHLQTPL